MEKKKSAVPAFLGVAAVWLGSHFGPGFATGAFSVKWYVKYGWVGLITPLLAMLITGGVMYYMLEYARAHSTPGYRPFAKSCYGDKFGSVVSILYDICFLMTMMCAGGLAFAGEGKLLEGFLGINYWVTAGITILISALLCLYGSKLLAKSSGYMMYAIIGVVVLITICPLSAVTVTWRAPSPVPPPTPRTPASCMPFWALCSTVASSPPLFSMSCPCPMC